MSVKLRLHRIGKKKQPYYRIVAIDSRKSRDGRYLEKIGHYNPILQPAEVVIDRDKAFKWLADGAIPTDSVRSLLQRNGIMLEWDLRKRGIAEEQIAGELSKFQEGRVQRQKRAEAKAAMAKRASEKEEKVEEKVEEKKAASPAVEKKEPEETPEAEAPVAAEPAAASAGETIAVAPDEKPQKKTAAEPAEEPEGKPAAADEPAAE